MLCTQYAGHNAHICSLEPETQRAEMADDIMRGAGLLLPSPSSPLSSLMAALVSRRIQATASGPLQV